MAELTVQKNAQLNDIISLLDHTEDAYLLWYSGNETFYYSSKVLALFNREPNAFFGDLSTLKQWVNSSFFANVKKMVNDFLINPNTNHCQLSSEVTTVTTEDGGHKWVEFSVKPIKTFSENNHCLYFSFRDITEIQTLITGLKKQNDFLVMAEKIGKSGHWRVDLVNETLYWSLGVYQIHGVNPENFQPALESAINFYLPNEREKVNRCVETAIKEGKGYHFKSAIKTRLGDIVKVESIGKVELDDKGQVIAVFGVIKDITQHEQQIEKLKLLSLVNHTINVPVFFIDEQDNVVYQELLKQNNGKTAILFNYINFSISEYLTIKSEAKNLRHVEYKNVSFDNYITVFNFSVTYAEHEKIYIWIIEDVTEQFKQEQQQIISNRLALLGNTFGNVSHDINNVLGVALGSLELLEMKLKQGSGSVEEYVERVKNAIDKGKAVTERLLAFTRQPKVDVTCFDPIKDIEENKYLFEQLLLHSIKFSVSHEADQCQIKFPKGEFINILLNIMLNAQDAIKENGLTGRIEMNTRINQNKLEVEIKDSGIGIEQKNVSKIFDPFYSSKSVNKGNGIGLANVYNMMYKYNGEVRVNGVSDIGGAQFILVFPIEKQLNKIQESTTVTHVQTNTSTMKHKTVLVLDDENSIAEFVCLQLETLGAIPIAVSNKTEFLKCISNTKQIDVIITDMILPDISGQEAVNIAVEKFPTIEIYSMSGYIGFDEDSWHYPLLRKPFNSAELLAFLP